MKIEKAQCPYCGAAMKMHPAQKTVKCDYCGSVSIVTGNDTLAGTQEGDPRKTEEPSQKMAGGGTRSGSGSAPGRAGYASEMSRKKAFSMGQTGIGDRLRSLLPPPGFRSGNVVHMLTAMIGYLFIFALAKSMTQPIEVLFCLIASLSVVDVFTDWTGLCSRLPGLRSSSTFVRVLMKLVWGGVVFTAWIVVMAIIENL